MVAVVEALTGDVCRVNEANVEPAGTTRTIGTMTAELPEEMETLSPAGPAGAESCIVPVELLPAITKAGETVKLVIFGKPISSAEV